MDTIEIKTITVKKIELEMGMVFEHPYYQECYILACVGGGNYCLISIESGNRWENPAPLEAVGNQIMDKGFLFKGCIKDITFKNINF